MLEGTGIEALGLSLHPSDPQGRATREVILADPDQADALDVARVTVTRVPPHPYQVELKRKVDGAIAEGDVCLLSFRARSVGGGAHGGAAESGTLLAKVQQSGPDWHALAYQKLAISPAWRTYHLPFKADRGFAAGGTEVALHLGYQQQAVEFADLTLTNYGDTVRLDALPVTSVDYAGRAADAPWREEALQRIETLRKSGLTLRVVDQDGQPLKGIPISVELERHAFDWGTAVAAHRLVQDGEDGEHYRRIVTELFNTVTIENALKWDLGEQAYFTKHRDAALEWIGSQGLKLRGHCVVWPGWEFLPKWLREHEDDPATLAAKVDERIATALEAHRGVVHEWDLVNEAHAYHDLMDILGDDAMPGWFRLAHKTDPDAVLVYNDFAALNFRGRTEAVATIAQRLVDAGAPVHALGLQGHFQSPPTGIDVLQTRLDRLAKTGLPLRITEFDIDTTDESLQADFTRDLMIVCYAHPAVEGLTTWGFWEGQHWRPRSAMFRKDWSAKPAAKVWRELVQERWHTQADVETDADGRVQLPAYHGRYRLMVGAGSQAVELRVRHAPGEKTHDLVLPADAP